MAKAKESAYKDLYDKLDSIEGQKSIYKLSKTIERRTRDLTDIARVAQSEIRKILRFRVVAEKVHSAREKYRESKVGRGGGSSRTQYETIRFASKNCVFFRRIPRSRKIRRFGHKSFFVRRLKRAIKIRR